MRPSKPACTGLLCVACTAPPPEPYELPASPIQALEPSLEYRHLPEAPEPPDPPPSFVGPNHDCPDLRVFADAEAVCAHGIMPRQPYGMCERMREVDDECDGYCSELVVERVDGPALHGHAELFVHHHISPGGVDSDEVFLALRGSNGYVLLDQVAWWHSQVNDPPELERLVGDTESLELRFHQHWWEKQLGEEEWGEADERWAFRCARDEQGTIRCEGKCPELGLDEPRPALDCEALADFDWSTLPRGKRVEPEDGVWELWRMDQFYSAATFVGLPGEDYQEAPAVVREVKVGRERVSLVGLDGSHWVLMHERVPLLASEGEIHAGRAPGGFYVSSQAGGQRRVHRLHLATHELEPVSPGACQGGWVR